MSQNSSTDAARFRSIATPALGAVIGALAAVPATLNTPPLLSFCAFVLFTVLGGAVGYKRRNSTIFFYFSLIIVCILASALSNSMFSAEQGLSSPASSGTTTP